MNRLKIVLLILLALVCAMPATFAQESQQSGDVPTAGKGPSVTDLTGPVKIVVVMTVLALVPAMLMTVTTFTRIVIVLSFVRRALSIQEAPPNQVIIGLSMFLTLLSMNTVFTDVYRDSLKPYVDERIDGQTAAKNAAGHLHAFLAQHAGEEEVKLFLDLSNAETPETPDDVSLTVLVPAFALSELKIAFKMGFLVYIPFLIVDIVVASILMAMGMFMLPPVIISTPFKILLFILVDGWTLVIRSLMQSFEILT